MDKILAVFSYAIDSMLLGVFITILGVALLYFLIRGFYPRYTFTPVSLIVGAILFVLLSGQSVLICGAFKIKGMADDIEQSINQNIPMLFRLTGHEYTEKETQEICEQLRDEYPLFACYIGGMDFEGHTPESIAASVKEELHDFLNAYIWKRLAWCIGFILVGMFLVIKTMKMLNNERPARHSSGSSRPMAVRRSRSARLGRR